MTNEIKVMPFRYTGRDLETSPSVVTQEKLESSQGWPSSPG
ncbi:hypothetical protein LEP1GSC191_3252 [Leptospira borgpetersenii serovar Mini str. 201000851]|uniref:Uncharacterized protein n=1 Tax=Leptospira borgpetersenii str. 200801926 TaxID=1193009 RepID=A0ABN0I1M1_LEPBO|nr:hypothetical protein LEP1GSC128_2326 [Leptospira borgpetersenii str. 200801926]ENO62180.1 hypothetical protein LEP1GSC191_3252 [Leptospira borgpetersenii serovar Mini str. 201000851]